MRSIQTTHLPLNHIKNWALRSQLMACAALVGTLVLTGCGPGEDPKPIAPRSSTGQTPTPTPAPGPAPAPVPGPAPVPSTACTTAPAAFTTTVWPSFKSLCTLCHATGQIAGGTGLVFNLGASDVTNYNILRNYARANPDRLLSKSIGQPNHGGGAPFGSTSSSQYQALASLIPVMQGACPAPTPTPSPTPTPTPTPAPSPIPAPISGAFWSGVAFMDNSTTLAKAAILFASRNPTTAEAQAVASGGEAALRTTIRSYMQGPAFDRFLQEVSETHFLPQRLLSVNFGTVLSQFDYPIWNQIFTPNQTYVAYSGRLVQSLSSEGTELVKYIVRNERPWTEIVTADYTMMNGTISRFLGASVEGAFTNIEDDTEWRRGTWQGPARFGGVREHAGILSTQNWLVSFPSTVTNRNRHRVRILAKQFLATDINALATRQSESMQTFRVAWLEDPNCKVCHDVMDPMTAGFQSHTPSGLNYPFNAYLFRTDSGGKNHSLAFDYTGNTYPRDANNQPYYRLGDAWYRDMVAPGYNGTLMPGGYTGTPLALRWLGQQIASDTRFPLGAVHFWYLGVFNREPLAMPSDTTDPLYAARLSAYNAQISDFNQIAARFASNGFRVKDLLVDLVMSRWFRTQTVTGLNITRNVELHDVGATHMLNTPALQRKLVSLLGMGYSLFDAPYRNQGLDYGDFNGNTRVKRANAYSTLQAATIDRLVASMSCSAARADFTKAANTRLLFPLVNLTDTPATTAGANAIVENIRHLHKWLLKEDLPATDPEIQRTYGLFTSIWNDRASAAPRPLNCAYGSTNDPNYTGRTWSAVLAYLVGDPKFLFE